MANQDLGYVKLWRSCLENGWLSNPELWAFWCYCLLRAAFKEISCFVGKQQITLSPGQFVFGRNKASKDLKMSVQRIRTCIESLKKAQNLTIKSTNKYSIISIVNWDAYQPSKNESNQQSNQQATIKQPYTRSKEDKTTVQNEVLELFDLFYKSYPKKQGKEQALKAWIKLNPSSELFETILSSLKQQKESEQWQKDKGQYIPLPATWLNGHRWEDETTDTRRESKIPDGYFTNVVTL